jgi:hypothetical protein
MRLFFFSLLDRARALNFSLKKKAIRKHLGYWSGQGEGGRVFFFFFGVPCIPQVPLFVFSLVYAVEMRFAIVIAFTIALGAVAMHNMAEGQFYNNTMNLADLFPGDDWTDPSGLFRKTGRDHYQVGLFSSLFSFLLMCWWIVAVRY